jgi:spore germination cell wall hydrolase CwlJ-like protein
MYPSVQKERKNMRALLAVIFLALLSITSLSHASSALPSLRELSEASTAPKDSSKADLYWMAMNIYHEAGNQPLIGKIAVGVVTLNRLHDKRYPKNIRDVVTEPQQFSWYNTKNANTPPANNSRWRESYEVAKLLLTKAIGSDIIKLLEGATHFHATSVKPDWINKVHKIAQIEGHIFYRLP